MPFEVGVAVPFEVGAAPFRGVFESPEGFLLIGLELEVLTVVGCLPSPFVVLLVNRSDFKNVLLPPEAALLPPEEPSFFSVNDDAIEGEHEGLLEGLVLLLLLTRIGLG